MFRNMSAMGHRLTEQDLDRTERRIGKSIPAEYRAFLLKYNGGHPDPSGFSMRARENQTAIGSVKRFLGVDIPERTLNLDYAIETFSERMPTFLFPIARDPGGNVITIATEGPGKGKVYFWDHEYESEDGQPPTSHNLYQIARTFDDFLLGLTDD
jgi:hypothetical protein